MIKEHYFIGAAEGCLTFICWTRLLLYLVRRGQWGQWNWGSFPHSNLRCLMRFPLLEYHLPHCEHWTVFILDLAVHLLANNDPLPSFSTGNPIYSLLFVVLLLTAKTSCDVADDVLLKSDWRMSCKLNSLLQEAHALVKAEKWNVYLY